MLHCCQMVYISYCFYEQPSYLFRAIKSLKVVTGGWFLFYSSDNAHLLKPFSDRVDITPQFYENNLVLLSILALVLIIYLLFSVLLKTDIIKRWKYILYNFLTFPIISGFFIVMSISAFYCNLRINIEENINIINAISLTFVLFLFGVIFSF